MPLSFSLTLTPPPASYLRPFSCLPNRIAEELPTFCRSWLLRLSESILPISCSWYKFPASSYRNISDGSFSDLILVSEILTHIARHISQMEALFAPQFAQPQTAQCQMVIGFPSWFATSDSYTWDTATEMPCVVTSDVHTADTPVYFPDLFPCSPPLLMIIYTITMMMSSIILNYFLDF